VEIDGRKIGRGLPFETVERISALYKARIEAECADR